MSQEQKVTMNKRLERTSCSRTEYEKYLNGEKPPVKKLIKFHTILGYDIRTDGAVELDFICFLIKQKGLKNSEFWPAAGTTHKAVIDMISENRGIRFSLINKAYSLLGGRIIILDEFGKILRKPKVR
jgi:transcriptional regulator with XRE-family HTH domain